MYLACFICILSMFDEKNPPKTWLICDILTGTTKSSLGHLLHAVFWNKTNLVEKNSVLHTRLKSYDNSRGFFVKKFDKIVQHSQYSLPKSTETFTGLGFRTAIHGPFSSHVQTDLIQTCLH